MHWNDSEEEARTVKWRVLQEKSKNRIDQIVQKKLKGSFGLGVERSLNDYKEFSGIDIKNKKIIDKETAFNFKKLFELDWKEATKKKSFLW